MSVSEDGHPPTGDQTAWFNQKLAQLREQRNNARENIYQLESDLRQLHRNIHGLSKNIDKSHDQINQLNNQLKASKAEIREQASRIQELEDTVSRQKRTIKVQSDKISETKEVIPRRTGHDPKTAIFDRPPPLYNQSQPTFNQPGMTYNQPQPPYNQPQPAHNQSQPYYNQSHPAYDQPQPVRNQHHLAYNQAHPTQNQSQPPIGYLRPSSADPSPQNPHAIIPFRPQSRQIHTRSANMLSVPSRGAGTPSPYSSHGSTMSSTIAQGAMEVYRPPSILALRSASYNNSSASQEKWMEETTARPAEGGIGEAMGALTIRDEGSVDEIPWPAEFGQFFKLTEDWARNYTNVPNENQDRNLPDDLFASMKRQASEDLVIKLLGSKETRFFLIARLMNIWITNDIFHGQCFLNFSTDFDEKFHQSSQIPQNDPIYTRASLLMAVADSAKEMQARPTFPQFLSSLMTMKVDGMWERLYPLLAPGIFERQAFDDIVHLIGEAIRMGLLMIGTPSVYSIDFPKAGITTYFRPDAMINRDPDLQADPQQLFQDGVIVRLGITPVVVITSFAGPAINPRTVHFANVLLQREPKRLEQ